MLYGMIYESQNTYHSMIYTFQTEEKGHYLTVTSNVSSCNILAFRLRHPRLCILVCRLQRDVCLVTSYDLKCAIADCKTSHGSGPSLLGLF